MQEKAGTPMHEAEDEEEVKSWQSMTFCPREKHLFSAVAPPVSPSELLFFEALC